MADLTYSATVDTSEAERNLRNLQKTIAGISFGAIINQAIQFADSIADLSDATEVSIANLIAFSQAVSQNGGSAEGAQKAIAKLVVSIDEAANKFGNARQAFEEAGVSLEDLRRLGTEDIFRKTVEGLGRINDVAKRNKLSVELLGKEFRAVNTAGVATTFAASTQESQKFADAVKSAAAANDKLAASFDKFRLQLLAALKPLFDFIESLDSKKIAAVTQTLIDIAQGLALLFIASKAAQGIRFLIDSFRVLGGQMKAGTGIIGEAAAGLRAMRNALDLTAVSVVSSYTKFGILGVALKSFAGGLIKVIPLVGTLYAGFQILDGVVEVLTGRDIRGWVDNWASGLENFVRNVAPGLANALDKLGEKLGMAPSPSAQRANQEELKRLEMRARLAQQAAEDLKRGQEAERKIAEAAAKSALEKNQYIQNLAIGLSRQTEAIRLEGRLLELSKLQNKLSEDDVEIIKAQQQADVQRLSQVRNLEEQIAKLRLEAGQTQDKDQQRILNNQIANITEQINKTNEYYNGHRENLAESLTYLQNIRKLDQARLADLENISAAINLQITRQQALNDIINDVAKQERQIQLGIQPAQLVGLTSLNRQIIDIRENARKAALEAQRLFATQFEDEDGLTPENVEKLNQGLDQIAKRFENLTEKQIAFAESSYEVQTRFSTGWKDAFAQFVEDATNSAKAGQDTFSRFARGFEDAFVSLVTTGKLSFRDLTNSILADLARLAAKQAFVQLFGGPQGGGLLGNFFGLFGKAGGGPVMSQRPYMVGESGPELFVPNAAGRIFPNNMLQGEKAPMAITYNINAVDAQSFRSLVARDPQFIYQVTEAGRRSTPSRRLA